MRFELALRWILGLRPSSTPGSNHRRALARVTLFVGLYFLLDGLALLGPFSTPPTSAVVAYAAMIWSTAFFGIVVVWVVFLSSHSYPPDPRRLVLDILTSGLFTITAFALVYRAEGIIDTLDPGASILRTDHLYFSAVTFSTLGFGDFRPSSVARLLAAYQAILGNLHLGLLAGAAFYTIQFRPESGPKGKLPDDDGDHDDDEQ